MISFFLEKDAPYAAEVRYILGTWAKSANEEIRVVEHPDNAVTVSDAPSGSRTSERKMRRCPTGAVSATLKTSTVPSARWRS